MCTICGPLFNLLFHFLSPSTHVHFSGGFEFFSGLFQFPLFRRWPTKQQTGGLVVVGIDQVDLAASSLGVLVCPTCCVGRCLDGIECTVAFVHVHSIRQRGLGIFPTGRLLIRTRCIDQRGRSRGEVEHCSSRQVFQMGVVLRGCEKSKVVDVVDGGQV